MTKSKRMFAEMLVQARGYGDADEIAKTMSLVGVTVSSRLNEHLGEHALRLGHSC